MLVAVQIIADLANPAGNLRFLAKDINSHQLPALRKFRFTKSLW